jgi:hypothetical protein
LSAIHGSASRNDYGATGWPARQFLVYTFDDYDAVIIVEFESDMHALSVMLADVAGRCGWSGWGDESDGAISYGRCGCRHESRAIDRVSGAIDLSAANIAIRL